MKSFMALASLPLSACSLPNYVLRKKIARNFLVNNFFTSISERSRVYSMREPSKNLFLLFLAPPLQFRIIAPAVEDFIV